MNLYAHSKMVSQMTSYRVKGNNEDNLWVETSQSRGGEY